MASRGIARREEGVIVTVISLLLLLPGVHHPSTPVSLENSFPPDRVPRVIPKEVKFKAGSVTCPRSAY